MDVQLLVISILIGVVVAFLVVGAMKAQLKSVRQQSGAANYVIGESLNLTVSRDMFLYKRVSRTPRAKSNN